MKEKTSFDTLAAILKATKDKFTLGWYKEGQHLFSISPLPFIREDGYIVLSLRKHQNKNDKGRKCGKVIITPNGELRKAPMGVRNLQEEY